MATEREKQLAITLLKERIEHATGKKVVLGEKVSKKPEADIIKEKLEKLTGKKAVLKEDLKVVTIDEMNTILQNAGRDTKILLNMATPVRVNKFTKNEQGEKIPNPAFSSEAGNSYGSLIKKVNVVEGTVNYDYYDELYRLIMAKEPLVKHLTDQGIDTNNKTTVIDWYKDQRKASYKQPDSVKEGAIKLNDKGLYYLPILNPKSASNKFDSEYLFKGETLTFEQVAKYLPPVKDSSGRKDVVVDELKPPSVSMTTPLLSNIDTIVLGSTEYQIKERV